MLIRCLAILLCVAAGCSSAKTEQAQAAPKPDAKVLIDHLLRQMSIPGRESTAAMQRGAKELFELPESVPTLIAEYRAVPADKPRARWKLLTLASKTTRLDAVEFLTTEAVKPLPQPDTSVLERPEHGAGSSTLNDEFVNRLAAAIGVVDSMNASRSDAQSAIAQIIGQAEKAVARNVGAELFARKLLTSQLTEALAARGINTQFSVMSRERVAQLFDAKPNFLTPPKNGSLPLSR